MIDLNYRYKKQNFIQAQKADPSPPLGTILGNLGVNTVNFCNKFNAFTEKLPSYFLLKVIIYIYDNKSIAFQVMLPTTSFIINLLKFETIIKVQAFDRINDKTIYCIKLFSLIKLAKFKFPDLDLKLSISII